MDETEQPINENHRLCHEIWDQWMAFAGSAVLMDSISDDVRLKEVRYECEKQKRDVAVHRSLLPVSGTLEMLRAAWGMQMQNKDVLVATRNPDRLLEMETMDETTLSEVEAGIFDLDDVLLRRPDVFHFFVDETKHKP